MAAHKLRFLLEMATRSGSLEDIAKMLDHALSYAPCCDQLHWDQWESLYKWCGDTMTKEWPRQTAEDFTAISDKEYELFNLIVDMLPTTIKEWQDMDRPISCEDWNKKRRGDESKVAE